MVCYSRDPSYCTTRTVTGYLIWDVRARLSRANGVACSSCTFAQVYFHPVPCPFGRRHSSDEGARALGQMENNPFEAYLGSYLNPCDWEFCRRTTWGGSKGRYFYTVLFPPLHGPLSATYATGFMRPPMFYHIFLYRLVRLREMWVVKMLWFLQIIVITVDLPFIHHPSIAIPISHTKASGVLYDTTTWYNAYLMLHDHTAQVFCTTVPYSSTLGSVAMLNSPVTLVESNTTCKDVRTQLWKGATSCNCITYCTLEY